MLYNYYSNSLQKLIKPLSKALDENSKKNILSTQIICVDNEKVYRYIQTTIAQTQKERIFANKTSIQPVSLLWNLCKGITDNLPPTNQYSSLSLTWHIFAIIDKQKNIPQHLQQQIKNNPVDKWILCSQIADILDDAQYYRIKELLDYKNNKNWLIQIWQQITDKKENVPKLIYKLSEAIKNNTIKKEKLPDSLYLVLPTNTPPIVWHIIAQISTIIDVHSFIITPTSEYWTDLISPKKQALLTISDDTDGYYDSGNDLLSSWGKSALNFFNLIIETNPGGEEEFCQTPNDKNLLEQIKDDIYKLENNIKKIDEKDQSLQIHNCHNKLRECEVASDIICDLMVHNKDLQKEDICIVAPDINEYMSLLSVVFNVNNNSILQFQSQHKKTSDDIFMLILKFSTSRFLVNDFINILNLSNLSNEDIDKITELFADSNLHWGKDENHKKTLGFSENNLNTWDFAFKRLFASYAMGSYADNFADISCIKTLDNDNYNYNLLGLSYEIYQIINNFSTTCQNLQELSKWLTNLKKLRGNLADFADFDDGFSKMITDLTKNQKNQNKQKVDAGFIIEIYKNYQSDRQSSPFMQGGLSFSDIHSSATIPFKVKYVLGMDMTKFPRSEQKNSFDILFDEPQKGDINKADEDRYAFLSTILSTGSNFIISYNGQDEQNNNELPPSTILRELQQYIGDKNLKIIQLEHPLNPYNEAYFDEKKKLKSYQKLWYDTAKTKKDKKINTENMYKITENKEQKTEFKLYQICNFYKNSSQQFCQHNNFNLDLSINETEEIKDDEPMSLESLDNWTFNNKTIHNTDDDFFNNLIQQGFLPQGNKKDELEQKSKTIQKKIPQILLDINTVQPTILTHTTKIGGFTFDIEIENYYKNEGLVFTKASPIKGTDIMEFWLHYLSLQLIPDINNKAAVKYIYFDKDNIDFKTIEFNAIQKIDAEKYLENLIKINSEGLMIPLPVFTNSAFEVVGAKKIKEWKLSTKKDWGYEFGKDNNEYTKLLFDGDIIESDDFKEYSKKMFALCVEYIK
ncbi:MAG: hypothetical protein DRQ51_09960 [Gammaproteobacteria bacterium]|nr:MAG: hypothetical protein DRQ51_09960 [Gammaproteobacteria bacterium]